MTTAAVAVGERQGGDGARSPNPAPRALGRVEGAALRHLGAFRGWHWENRFPPGCSI